MAYKLTLTASERSAMDWVGGRYAHGNDLFKLLCGCQQTPEDADWDSDVDIEFNVPEHVAWQIGEMGNECNYIWDCLSSDFAKKLTDFCMAIV